MPKSPSRLKSQSHLRTDAEARIKHGIAPRTNGWILSPDVLESLFKLASDPDRAGDALKLLHELQVHQVELDLQMNQLESSSSEIIEELIHYQTLFEFAPIGYLVLGYDGRVIESNVLGTTLLGVDREELGGHFADSFIAPESRSTFIVFLKKLRDGGPGASCTVQSASGARRLQLTATMAPSTETILVTVNELAVTEPAFNVTKPKDEECQDFSPHQVDLAP